MECMICVSYHYIFFSTFCRFYSHLLLNIFPQIISFADRENATVGPWLKNGFNRVKNYCICFVIRESKVFVFYENTKKTKLDDLITSLSAKFALFSRL